MNELLVTIHPWQWLVLGIVLLAMETFGAGGFLIGIALAALVQSLVAAFFHQLSWDFQLFIFAINSVLFTVLYWRFFRKFNQKTDASIINNRAAQYIGRKLILENALEFGEGKIKIGDTLWRVQSDSAIPAGSGVEVVGAEGMVLLIKPSIDKSIT